MLLPVRDSPFFRSTCDAFAAFVKHLRDACQQPALVERSVEADSNKAGREFRCIAHKALWNAHAQVR